MNETECIIKAIIIAMRYGQIDGNHHKQWVIDQMLRALLPTQYDELIKTLFDNDWDTGIAP